MSIIRYTEIDLTQLIEDSDIIVQVKFIDTFSESLPISNGEGNLPPFVKKGFVFKVLNILKNKDTVNVPEMIQVPEENWRRSFNQHKEKHAGGKSKSFDVKKYVSDIKSMKKADLLFLYHFQGMYELTAKDSFGSNALSDKLEMLLK